MHSCQAPQRWVLGSPGGDCSHLTRVVAHSGAEPNPGVPVSCCPQSGVLGSLASCLHPRLWPPRPHSCRSLQPVGNETAR